MRSRGGTRTVGVFVAQVLATCTSQSSRRALFIECYACRGAHNITLRTWSFVLKQRGLGHEDGERVRGKACFLCATLLPCAQHHEDQLGPLRSGEGGCGVSRKRSCALQIFFKYEFVFRSACNLAQRTLRPDDPLSLLTVEQYEVL